MDKRATKADLALTIDKQVQQHYPHIKAYIKQDCAHCKHCNCRSRPPPAPIYVHHAQPAPPIPPHHTPPAPLPQPAPTLPPYQPRLKIHEPPIFNGNNDVHTFETWTRVFVGYLKGMQIHDDEARLDVLLRLLGQRPQGLLIDYYTAQNEGRSYPGICNEAVQILWRMYMMVDPSIQAQKEVKTYKQLGTQMFTQYMERMTPFFTKCKLEDIAIINYIKQNMNQALCRKIAGNVAIPQTTYQAYLEGVVTYEAILVRDRGWTYSPRPVRPLNAPSTSPNAPKVTPIGTTPRSTTNNWNPSKGDIKDAVCFNCNSKGHLASSCPQPKKTRPQAARAAQIEEIKEGFAGESN